MELWELNAILDTELSKPEAQQDLCLIKELSQILGIMDNIEGKE